MRTYRKRTPTLRYCVQCHAPFESAHKRRIYCGNSCSTLAYYARKAQAASASPTLPGEAITLAGTTPTTAQQPVAERLTLDWNGQNLAVLSAASFMAQVGVSVGKRLWDAFTAPSDAPTPLPADDRPANPLDWLPTGLLSSAAPRVSLELPGLGQTLVFVQLSYLGHTLFYQPSQRVLLWRVAPGQLMALLNADQLALVTELPAYEEVQTRPSVGQAVRMPQILG